MPCRNHIHIFWQARLWKDHHQNAGNFALEDLLMHISTCCWPPVLALVYESLLTYDRRKPISCEGEHLVSVCQLEQGVGIKSPFPYHVLTNAVSQCALRDCTVVHGINREDRPMSVNFTADASYL